MSAAFNFLRPSSGSYKTSILIVLIATAILIVGGMLDYFYVGLIIAFIVAIGGRIIGVRDK